MLNLPVKLRDSTTYCVPKGPSFVKAKRLNFKLKNTKISIKLPKHSTSVGSREEFVSDINECPDAFVLRSYDQNFVKDDSWKSFDLLYRSWGFYGPWLTGAQAELSAWLGLVSKSEPDMSLSFFHPRVFENAVGDFLTFRYSSMILSGRQKWNAPVNWKPIGSLSIPAVILDVVPDQVLNAADDVQKCVFFPINDTCLAQIEFVPRQFINAPLSERDKLIDPSPMNELVNNIINSLQVTLSPEAQAQQKRALEGLDDTSLRKEFPPIKWTTPEQDAEWEEYARLSGIKQD